MEKLKEKPWFQFLYFGVLITLSIILMIYQSINADVPVSDNPEQMPIYGEEWGITGIRGARTTHFYEIKATDKHVFFAYFDENIVDAYSYDGTFQFSILTRDAKNGGVSITCIDDTLYLSPKTGDILVFRGTEFLETVTRREAIERGIFKSDTYPVTVDREYVYSIDENGNKQILFPTLEEVQRNWPLLDFGPTINLMIYRIMALASVIFVLIMFYNVIRNAFCPMKPRYLWDENK